MPPPERKRPKTEYDIHFFDLPSDSESGGSSDPSDEEVVLPSLTTHAGRQASRPSSTSRPSSAGEPSQRPSQPPSQRPSSDVPESMDRSESVEQPVDLANEPSSRSQSVGRAGSTESPQSSRAASEKAKSPLQSAGASNQPSSLPAKAHTTLSGPFIDLTVSSEPDLPARDSHEVIDLLSSEEATPAPPKPATPEPVLVVYESIYPGHETKGEYKQAATTSLSFLFGKFPLDAVVTFDGDQIYSYSSPHMLSSGTKLEFTVMDQNQYDEQENAKDGESASEAGSLPVLTSEAEVAPSEDGQYFGIQIHFKDGKSMQLAVSPDTSFEKLATHILASRKLTPADIVGRIVLKFDDEPLDFSETIGDTDIEAGDIIDAHYTTKSEA